MNLTSKYNAFMFTEGGIKAVNQVAGEILGKWEKSVWPRDMPLTQVNEFNLKKLRYMPPTLQLEMMMKCGEAIYLDEDDFGTFRGMFTTTSLKSICA